MPSEEKSADEVSQWGPDLKSISLDPGLLSLLCYTLRLKLSLNCFASQKNTKSALWMSCMPCHGAFLTNSLIASGFVGASPLLCNAGREVDRPLATTASEPSVHAIGVAGGGGQLVAPTSTALRHALPRSFRKPRSGNVSRFVRASDAKRALVLCLRSLLCQTLCDSGSTE